MPYLQAQASPGSPGGMGVHSPRFAHGQLPMLHGDSGASGRGVHTKKLTSPALISEVGNLAVQIPHLGNEGRGMHRPAHTHALTAYFRALAEPLRRVRVTCGDFARVLGPSVTWRHGVTAVLLDPPYAQTERATVYAVESDAAHRARAWAIENGGNSLLRIAYCGYDTGEAWPDGWQAVAWKAPGGYGSQGTGRGRANAERETIWFSPHCLNETPLERAIREATA